MRVIDGEESAMLLCSGLGGLIFGIPGGESLCLWCVDGYE